MTNITLTSDLSGLLGRVEEATGADRELDALIMCALVAGPGAYVEQSKINGAWCIYYAPNRIWSMDSKAGTWREGGWPLTASLNAALALCERVLPGWLRMLDEAWIALDPVKTEWTAVLTPPHPGPRQYATALTAAVALLAAMLRALIAQGEARPAEHLSRSGRK